jgi:hypothetical protein
VPISCYHWDPFSSAVCSPHPLPHYLPPLRTGNQEESASLMRKEELSDSCHIIMESTHTEGNELDSGKMQSCQTCLYSISVFKGELLGEPSLHACLSWVCSSFPGRSQRKAIPDNRNSICKGTTANILTNLKQRQIVLTFKARSWGTSIYWTKCQDLESVEQREGGTHTVSDLVELLI